MVFTNINQLLVGIIYLAIFLPIQYKTIKYIRNKYPKKLQKISGFTIDEIKMNPFYVRKWIGFRLSLTNKLNFDDHIKRNGYIGRVGTIVFLLIYALVTYYFG